MMLNTSRSNNGNLTKICHTNEINSRTKIRKTHNLRNTLGNFVTREATPHGSRRRMDHPQSRGHPRSNCRIGQAPHRLHPAQTWTTEPRGLGASHLKGKDPVEARLALSAFAEKCCQGAQFAKISSRFSRIVSDLFTGRDREVPVVRNIE
jgi:hypothetical protein